MAWALHLACLLCPLPAPFAEGGEEILSPLSQSHRVILTFMSPNLHFFLHSFALYLLNTS